jgi:hypothetical protein
VGQDIFLFSTPVQSSAAAYNAYHPIYRRDKEGYSHIYAPPLCLGDTQQGRFFKFFLWRNAGWSASFLRFLNHTQWHTTVGRSHLDKWSTRSRNFYMTINNAHKRQTSRPPAGFESAIPASDRPQTLALDRSDTGIGYRVSFICTFVERLLGRRSSDGGTYRGHHIYRNWYAQNKHARPRGRVRSNPLSSVNAYNLTSCTAGVISAFYLKRQRVFETY